MDELTPTIAAEVMAVLYNADTSLISRIPYKIWEFLDDKAMDCEERKDIIVKTLTEKENISDAAKAVISLIYKDYFCESDEEKTEINNAIIEGKKELEQEQKEKYSPFKDTVQEEKEDTYKKNGEISINDSALAVPKKWYQKLIERLKLIFK